MEKTAVIKNEEGLHARPAGAFVKMATQYKSNIQVQFKEKSANGKSLMALMALGLTKDSLVTIKAEGEDADLALQDLTGLIDRKFQ